MMKARLPRVAQGSAVRGRRVWAGARRFDEGRHYRHQVRYRMGIGDHRFSPHLALPPAGIAALDRLLPFQALIATCDCTSVLELGCTVFSVALRPTWHSCRQSTTMQEQVHLYAALGISRKATETEVGNQSALQGPQRLTQPCYCAAASAHLPPPLAAGSPCTWKPTPCPHSNRPLNLMVQIRRAYRNLASKAHPDKGGDPETFRAIQQASFAGFIHSAQNIFMDTFDLLVCPELLVTCRLNQTINRATHRPGKCCRMAPSGGSMMPPGGW